MNTATPRDPSKLEQVRWFRKKQSFEISDDHRLIVTVSGPFKHENWSVPLDTLDSSPTRQRSYDFKPLVLAIPFTAIAILCLVMMISDFLVKDYEGTTGNAIIAFVFMCISSPIYWMIYARALNVLRFNGSTGANLPLWFNNPNQEKFETFVRDFKEAIESAKAIQPQNLTLASEIQALKDLFDRGLLDKDQFESAKNKLVSNHAPQKIGF